MKKTLLVTVFIMLLSCTGQKQQAEQQQPAAKIPFIEEISVKNQSLGWDNIVIGMTRSQIEVAIGDTLSVVYSESPVCGEYFSDITYKNEALSLQFESSRPDATLQSIFLPFFEGEERGNYDKRKLVSSLKQHIPELIYQPSRHNPDMPESENETPLYLLKDNNDMAILVKPQAGIFLSLLQCLD